MKPTQQANDPRQELQSQPDHFSTDNQSGITFPMKHDNKENTNAGKVIFTYTRKQAVADGVQVDVTETAKECGFKVPVFLTHSVFDAYVRVPAGVEAQDEAGRLWDILWMAYNAIRRSKEQNPLAFQLHVRNDNRKARKVTLHAVCEALDFDDLRPAITITLPYED